MSSIIYAALHIKVSCPGVLHSLLRGKAAESEQVWGTSFEAIQPTLFGFIRRMLNYNQVPFGYMGLPVYNQVTK